ncbi:hypothetical protein ACVISU_007528 [Bradyrhizobium sp. USDA 4452]
MRGLRVTLFILIVPTAICMVILVTLHNRLSNDMRGWMWLGLIGLWAEAALHAFVDWVRREPDR